MNPGFWASSVLNVAFKLLLAALALYVAVELIASVWRLLLAGSITAGAVVALTMFFRHRYRGW